MPRDKAATHYDSIENVIQLIKKYGIGALMAKLDIEAGFRNIPIHPSDYHVLGIVWDGKFYFENSLPLGMMSIV